MTNTPNQIAEKVHTIRRIDGLSVAALAIESGISEKTMQRRLNAPERFTVAELIAVARTLHVDLENLVSESEQAHSVAA